MSALVVLESQGGPNVSPLEGLESHGVHNVLAVSPEIMARSE